MELSPMPVSRSSRTCKEYIMKLVVAYIQPEKLKVITTEDNTKNTNGVRHGCCSSQVSGVTEESLDMDVLFDKETGGKINKFSI